MNEEKFMQAMAEAMKRTEDRFVERGFAIRHIENSRTGISAFAFNEKGIMLSDFVKHFFDRKNMPENPIPLPDCVAFVHLLIDATSSGDGR